MPPLLMNLFGVLHLELKKPFWVNPSLSGTIKNHLKEWLRNKKWTNNFLGPFPLKFFTTIYIYIFFSCLFVACINIWLEVYFGTNKMKIVKKLYS
jgi:hypothetical protein